MFAATNTFLVSNPGTTLQTWTVPSDWSNSNNQVACIGAGGKGADSTTAALGGGGGGGGGAYASSSNIILVSGASISYFIGAEATSTGPASAIRASETWFNSTASSTATISCAFGKPGMMTATSTGGSIANSTGTTKYAGGSGGYRAGGTLGGGGGGGSAGIYGAGKDGSGGHPTYAGGNGGGGSNGRSSTVGSISASNFTGGAGGAGTSGTGGGAGGTNTVGDEDGHVGTDGGGGGGGRGRSTSNTSVGDGGSGGLDTSFDATHGAGGGGGGGGAQTSTASSYTHVGGFGGTYGGGGGGGGRHPTAVQIGGTGGQGLIFITYTGIVPGTMSAPIFSTVSYTSLTVLWTATTTADTYNIERCAGVGCSSFSTIATGIDGAENHYDDSGLTAGETYTYKIWGTNPTGDGIHSAGGTIRALPSTDTPITRTIRLRGNVRLRNNVRLR